jgi:hypothetical protein
VTGVDLWAEWVSTGWTRTLEKHALEQDQRGFPQPHRKSKNSQKSLHHGTTGEKNGAQHPEPPKVQGAFGVIHFQISNIFFLTKDDSIGKLVGRSIN